MKRLRRTLVGVALGAALAGSASPALAYQAGTGTPEDAPTAALRSELAASTLTASDMPDGFVFVGETFLTADQVAAGVLDPAALTGAGFQAQYVSVYENRSEAMRLRTYVSAWADPAAAEAGFGLLEDEATLNPGAALTDAGAEVGEEPRETTTGSYPDASGATIATIDTTFRRDNLIAGVALEKLDGTEVSVENAAELARRLDARVQQVQQGSSPSNADLTLPNRVLALGSLGTERQVGFLGPAEIEHIYGLQGSVLDSVESTWAESVVLGGVDAPGPTVTVGVTTFADPSDAADVVQNADQLAVPLANQEAVEGAALENADSVRAFRFTSPNAAAPDAVDSYRIIFATGATLTVIDVQGASSDQVATDAAMALAQAQLGCQTGGPCDLPQLPADLTGGA